MEHLKIYAITRYEKYHRALLIFDPCITLWGRFAAPYFKIPMMTVSPSAGSYVLRLTSILVGR